MVMYGTYTFQSHPHLTPYPLQPPASTLVHPAPFHPHPHLDPLPPSTSGLHLRPPRTIPSHPPLTPFNLRPPPSSTPHYSTPSTSYPLQPPAPTLASTLAPSTAVYPPGFPDYLDAMDKSLEAIVKMEEPNDFLMDYLDTCWTAAEIKVSDAYYVNDVYYAYYT